VLLHLCHEQRPAAAAPHSAPHDRALAARGAARACREGGGRSRCQRAAVKRRSNRVRGGGGGCAARRLRPCKRHPPHQSPAPMIPSSASSRMRSAASSGASAEGRSAAIVRAYWDGRPTTAAGHWRRAASNAAAVATSSRPATTASRSISTSGTARQGGAGAPRRGAAGARGPAPRGRDAAPPAPAAPRLRPDLASRQPAPGRAASASILGASERLQGDAISTARPRAGRGSRLVWDENGRFATRQSYVTAPPSNARPPALSCGDRGSRAHMSWETPVLVQSTSEGRCAAGWGARVKRAAAGGGSERAARCACAPRPRPPPPRRRAARAAAPPALTPRPRPRLRPTAAASSASPPTAPP
jgi:hypothetical protein